jgi:two-component system, sensor histidine kinase LadS
MFCRLLCSLLTIFFLAHSSALAREAVTPWDQVFSVQVVDGVSADSTVAQVSALAPERFAPFDATKRYRIDQNHAMWLRIQPLSNAKPAVQSWILGFPQNFVDRFSLHRAAPDGSWVVQSAGEHVAHDQWPIAGLYPRFEVSANAAVGTYYLRIKQTMGLRLKMDFRPEADAQRQAQNDFLVGGVLLGLMAVMGLASAVLALLYRHAAYVWYGIYALLALLAAASYLGVAGNFLWPGSERWPQASFVVFIAAAALMQVQFCRAIFAAYAADARMRWLVGVAAVLVPGCMAGMTAVGSVVLQMLLLGLSVLACALPILTLVARAWRSRSAADRQVAALWVLGYTPLVASIVMGVLDGMEVLNLQWMHPNTPVYALFFEMPTLLLALHWNARNRWFATVRAQALNELDPLTGVATQAAFTQGLAQVWREAIAAQTDVAVAYVRIEPAYRNEAESARQRTLRAVRLLRTVTRAQDIVAWRDETTFALVMRGVSPGAGLSARVQRLVALGLANDGDEPLWTPLRFRVVLSTRASLPGPLHEFDAALRAAIHQLTLKASPAIRFVPS